MNYQKNPDAVLKKYNLALEHVRPNSIEEAEIHEQMGLAYDDLGWEDLAFEEYENAIIIREVLGVCGYDTVKTYNRMADLLIKEDAYEEALQCSQKSLDILIKEETSIGEINFVFDNMRKSCLELGLVIRSIDLERLKNIEAKKDYFQVFNENLHLEIEIQSQLQEIYWGVRNGHTFKSGLHCIFEVIQEALDTEYGTEAFERAQFLMANYIIMAGVHNAMSGIEQPNALISLKDFVNTYPGVITKIAQGPYHYLVNDDVLRTLLSFRPYDKEYKEALLKNLAHVEDYEELAYVERMLVLGNRATEVPEDTCGDSDSTSSVCKLPIENLNQEANVKPLLVQAVARIVLETGALRGNEVLRDQLDHYFTTGIVYETLRPLVEQAIANNPELFGDFRFDPILRTYNMRNVQTFRDAGVNDYDRDCTVEYPQDTQALKTNDYDSDSTIKYPTMLPPEDEEGIVNYEETMDTEYYYNRQDNTTQMVEEEINLGTRGFHFSDFS